MTKKILVFSAVPGIGGVTSMAVDMAQAFSSLGHEVTLAQPERSGALRIEPRPTTVHGFPAVSLASFRSYYILLHTWNWGSRWRRYLSTFDAAVVVTGSPYIAVPFLDSLVPVYVWSAVTMREDLKGRLEQFSIFKKLAYGLALPLIYGDERRRLGTMRSLLGSERDHAERPGAGIWQSATPSLGPVAADRLRPVQPSGVAKFRFEDHICRAV